MVAQRKNTYPKEIFIMAGKFENFNSFVEEFNKNHGVNFSFERYETKLKQTDHMRAFFTGKGEISAEDFAYRSVARELFREAVESLIAKKVSSVEHTAFLNDFDKLMDNYRDYCEKTGVQKPGKNGGWGNNVDMINDLTGKINDIPDDKSDFIKNSYIKRTIRLRDMRADIEGMGKENPITAEELSRAIVYAKALEKTVKERSGWWRAFHRIQGPAEKRDLKALNEFIGKHRDSDIYEKAVAFADEKAVGVVKSKIEAAKEEIKEKELLKPRKLKEARQAEERLRNPKIKDHVLKVMSGIVKESTSDDRSKVGLLNSIVNENPKIMLSAWKAFENANTPEAKENAIIKNVQDVFNVSYKWVNGLSFKDKGQSSIHDKIVASQRITNLILKQYSPAMSDATYEKYHNDYIVNDKKFMEGFLRENLSIKEMSDKDLDNILNAIKDDISQKKFKVKDLEKDINLNNVETSKKHNEALSKESPNKSLN
jgi:hypothetical protein